MAKQIWANLSVKDVEQTRKFYKELGFKLNKGRDNGDQLASFLIGDDNFVVHFFPKNTFRKVTEGKVADLKQGNEVLFTLSAESRKEVDEWANKVKNAGGTIFSEPQEIPGGMYGCGFADLDGHKWNVFYNDRN